MLLVLSVSTADAQGLKGLWKKIKKDWNETVNSSSSAQSTSSSSTRNSTVRSGDIYKTLREKAISSMPHPTGKPLPVVQGWTLVKSNTVAGFKCDHYEKGNQAVRVFKKDNGDFITLLEDESGLSREPDEWKGEVSYKVYPIGEYRMTTSGSIVVTGGYDDTFYYTKTNSNSLTKEIGSYVAKAIKYTYPSGDAISVRQFGTGKIEDKPIDKWSLMYGYKVKEQDKGQTPPSWDNFKNSKKALPNGKEEDDGYLYLSETPDKRYIDAGGFLIGDRLYGFDYEAGSITTSWAQIFNGERYEALPSDTVISATKQTYNNGYIDQEGKLVKFANGDEVLYDHIGYILSCKVHRLGGVVTVKNGKTLRIDYPDGKIFAGTLAYPEENHILGTIIFNELKASEFNLVNTDLRPWTGTFEYPDGTLVNITEGKTDKEVAAEKAAREAAEKKEKAAKEKAKQQELQALYKQYGKQYVDIVMSGKYPVVGMPIGLVKKFYDCREAGGDSFSKYYRIYGNVKVFTSDVVGYTTKYDWVMTIWVRNNRVTSIRKYY